MGENSNIEWTHHTFNPWIGCSKVHGGCKHCYAETMAKRYGWTEWGPTGERKVTSDANWKKPLAWARAAAKAGERHRVFCASLADVLDERAPVEAQTRLWELIRRTARMASPHTSFAADVLPDLPLPGLDYLLLTKRPERWEIIPEDVRPLVWLGTSVSDQETANEWIPRLLGAQGFAKRFLSMEPLVGPVDLSPVIGGPYVGLPGDVIYPNYNFGIDWVIVGGESGHGARLCDLSWIRSIVDQCRGASVPCFVKQFGARPRGDYAGRKPPVLSNHPATMNDWILADKKGGDPSEWPTDLRVRQFPEVARG